MNHQEALEREAYLNKTIEENPEYAAILPLFIAMCEHVRENAGTGGVTFAVPTGAEQRVRAGMPAITADDLEIDAGAARAFVRGLAERLMALEIGDAAQFRSFQHIDEGEIPKLLTAWFKGQRGPIQSAAFRLRVNPGVLESLLAVPVKEAAVAAAAEVPVEWHADWEGLNCPVCGSEPSMSRLEPGEKKSLSCGVCRTRWKLDKPACALCGNDDPEKLSYIAVEGDPVRVDVCCKCGRYIKNHHVPTDNADVPLDLLDVTTMHLDILAERHGFTRG